MQKVITQMARVANPNKEKIQAVKSEIKDHAKIVRQGESAAKKLAKLNERLEKLTGTEVAAPKAKAKAAKAEPVKAKKTKVDAAAEKKKTKVVVNKKRPGRPRKSDEEDED